MDSVFEIEKNQKLDYDSLNDKLNNYLHTGDNCNGIGCVESRSRCASGSSEIFELFSKGVTQDNYDEFCNLFSKNVFKRRTESSYSREDCGNGLGSDFNYVDEKNYEYKYFDTESQKLFWESLEWFVNILEELNRFEALGFGVSFLMNKFKVLTGNKVYESHRISKNGEHSEIIDNIKKWIDFISVFRDANNSIYTTYTLLEIMEVKLSHIKYKLIKMLQLKQTNKSKSMSANISISSPLGTSLDNIENTPINTPSSTATNGSDKGDNDILCEIWDEQLKKIQLLVFNKFRHYVINMIEQLRFMYPSSDYWQIIEFIVYANANVVKGEYIENERNAGRQGTEMLDDQESSKNRDVCDTCAFSKNLNIDGVIKDAEDMLEYLEGYYTSRNMSEEKAESYVKRIVDLNKRLIPKFVKINSKLPIYYEAYLNALVCNEIQDGVFQLITSNGHSNYRSAYKDGQREKESYSDEGSGYKSWLQKIGVIKLLNKTNLEVVDVVRCTFNGGRKVVAFTQGALKDFLNCSGNYKDYKDTYKELYRDSVIIKGDKQLGVENSEDISSSIYFYNNNLNEVATKEIEKVMISMLPNFNWCPKIVKHQQNYQNGKNNYNYKAENDFENVDEELREGLGMKYIEYNSLEEKIWLSRLNMFNNINERNIKNMLLERNNNMVKRVEYESTNLLINNKTPLKVLLDYNNYIPIKYIYNEPKNTGEKPERENSSGSGSGSSTDGENDWIIRLFNSNNRVFKNGSIDIEVESDLFPGFYLFDNHKLNCFILPIHENEFKKQETFQNFIKLVESKLDLIYPPYLGQINKIGCESKNGGLGNKFSGKYGDFFTTYHTNLCVGTKDKMMINLVFHLVCCDTSVNDDIGPIEYAEDTEVILNQVKKMEPILNGLSRILETCNKYQVQTVNLPVSLKCCYKINQCNNNVIQTEFQTQSSGGSHLNVQLNIGSGVNSKEGVFECNSDYVRCLAVVSHLASLLNKNKYSISNFNLIFPQHLKQTLLPKTASNIFKTRVKIF